MATAVSIAQKTSFAAPTRIQPSTSNNMTAPSRMSQQPQPILKHLIPAQSILKPFLPKVNTASTRVHPPSTTTNITAASNAVKNLYTTANSGMSTSYSKAFGIIAILEFQNMFVLYLSFR